jgi:glycosyltransferase involved in cell wall biosynthesis
MKISLFVHSLDLNPIVRAKPVADALVSMGHEVEVLGLLIRGDKVYAPYRTAFEYKTVRTTRHVWSVLSGAKELARMATGEAAYAFKPLISSFWPALRYSDHGRRCPLFLDVEDDDVQSKRPLDRRARLRSLFDGWLSSTSYRYNAPLHKYVGNCSGVTVASERLRDIYGGRILLHGPVMEREPCEIGSPEQLALKGRYNLPGNKRVLLFAGMAQAHKGFDILSVAAAEPAFRDHFHLALAGDPEQAAFRDIKSRLGDACTLMGKFDVSEMAEVVQAADLVPVIQADTIYTRSQIPAKLLEAFACGRPAIGSAVGDLPSLITSGPQGPRGWIRQARSVEAFLSLLFDSVIREGDQGLRARGLEASCFYKEECSPEAIKRVLRSFPLLAKP